MAKNKKNDGLFGDSVMGLAENAKKSIEEREAAYTTQTHNTDTHTEYTIMQEETRSKRIQIVIKPSVNQKLDRLVRQEKIKSKNDLINFLLEQYISSLE